MAFQITPPYFTAKVRKIDLELPENSSYRHRGGRYAIMPEVIRSAINNP